MCKFIFYAINNVLNVTKKKNVLNENIIIFYIVIISVGIKTQDHILGLGIHPRTLIDPRRGR